MKTKQELVAEKLTRAEKVFGDLSETIKNKKEIPENLKELALSAQNYAKGNHYDACMALYSFFGISKEKYPLLAEELKKFLRNIASLMDKQRAVPAISLQKKQTAQLAMFGV